MSSSSVQCRRCVFLVTTDYPLCCSSFSCDPHPGNLLRTTDGKLCILDWGMTLGVPNDLQYALLEFIAHINSEDYDAIPQDFISLGFSPENVSLERLQSSGITEGLSLHSDSSVKEEDLKRFKNV